MGVTGAGKSTFIERVTGQNVGIGHSLMSHTVGVGIYAYQVSPYRRIYLIDTPGFDDTSRSDTEVLKEVAFFLSQIYRYHIQLAGIVYLHRITDNRVSGTALKNLNMFKKLCGPEAFGHVVLATSMWNAMDSTLAEVGIKRERELVTTAGFWGTMHKSGSQVARWTGDGRSAQAIVGKIIEMHDRSGRTVLKIQEQLVNGNLSLEETDAGMEVQREIAAARAKLQEEIDQLREAQKEMERQSNETLAKELAQQRQEFEKQLVDANEAQEALKVSLRSLVEQKTAEYEARLTSVLDDQRRLTESLQQKEAEIERSRRMHREDADMFRETQTQLASELAALNRKIKEQEQAKTEAEAREAARRKRELEEEKRAVEELQEEMQRQQREEEEAAANRQRALQADIERRKKRKQSQKKAMGFLGVVAGVGTVAAGFVTLNPALVGFGASMASASARAVS